MKYLLALVMTVCLSFGALASEMDPLTPKASSLNHTEPDVILMKEDVIAVPLGYKAGNCLGRFLACWNKASDDEQAEGLGLKFQSEAAKDLGTAAVGVASPALICLLCGVGGCCYNGDACCVRYAGSCCVFCGNGGCIIAAKWTGVAVAALLGAALCCYVSRECCKHGCPCDQKLEKLKCVNCARGMRDGYNKKNDSQINSLTNQSYQDISHLQMI